MNMSAGSGASQDRPAAQLNPPPSHDDEEEYRRRLSTYRTACRNRQGPVPDRYPSSLIIFDEPAKLGYCFVAKVGCTFWLRILSFLTRKKDMVKLGIKTPFDIDRSRLHTGELASANWQRPWDMNKTATSHTLRFLFTRNPFQRLWSVYLDKYYLPDYWVTHPIGESKCCLNVTFQNFLDKVVNWSDHHVIPITKTCDPCTFRPHFIGAMETFSRDSKYLLQVAGYQHFLENYTHEQYIDDQVQTLVTYNFKVLRYPLFAKEACLPPKELCRRIWRVFQCNGLIKTEIPFHENLPDYSHGSALKYFLDTVRSNRPNKEQSARQRKEAIGEAYGQIKWSTIHSLQLYYREDFDMFNYDLRPPS